MCVCWHISTNSLRSCLRVFVGTFAHSLRSCVSVCVADCAMSSGASLVLDCGSYTVKAGLSTEEVPHLIRSIVGKSRRDPQGPTFAGDSALGLGNGALLNEPISEGQIDDFVNFEILLDFVYNTVVEGEVELPVVLAEPVFSSEPNREKLVELFFEHFNSPSISFTLQGVLALVGTGRVTGLVLDCGHSGCQTVPIFESYVLPHSIGSMKVGGRDLDTLLAKLLAIKSVRLAKTSDKEVLREIKEMLSFCRRSGEITECECMDFRLPDGHKITIGRERFVVPEAMFRPNLIGVESEGVAALVCDSIRHSPMDLTKPLVSNIIVSGGSSMFDGFPTRLASEVKYKVSHNMAREVRVVAADDRKNSVWNGGKAFADLRDSFEDRWMTKAEYEEFGAGYIQNRVMTTRSS